MTSTTTSGTVEHDDYPGRLLMEARAEIERLRAPPTEAEVEAAAYAICPLLLEWDGDERPCRRCVKSRPDLVPGCLWQALKIARAALEAEAKERLRKQEIR